MIAKSTVFEKMNKRAVQIITLIIVLAYLTSVTILSDITVFYAAKYFVFNVLAVYICGFAVIKVLNVRLDTSIQEIGLSYATGYLLQILNYFILVPLGARAMLPAIILIEIALSLVYLLKIREKTPAISVEKWDVIVFACFLLLIFTWKFVLGFASLFISTPDFINNYHQTKDLFYHCQDTISAKYQFPLTDLRNFGVKYYYHYFSSIFNSVQSYVLNIPVVRLEAELEQVQGGLLLGFSFFSLIEYACQNTWLKVWAVIAVFFSIGNDAATGMSFMGDMFVAPFGCDCGIGISIFLFFLVLRQVGSEFDRGLFVLTTLFALGATGVKGPCAMGAICGVGVILLVELFKKNYKVALSYGISLLVSFGLVYVFFVAERNGGKADITQSSLFSFGLESLQPFYVWTYFDKLTGIGVPSVLAKIFVCLLWMFESKPAILLMILFAIVLILYFRIKPDKFIVASTCTYIFGLIMAFFVNQSGSSQMYFAITGYTIAPVMCVAVLQNVLDRSCINSRTTTDKKSLVTGLLTSDKMVFVVLAVSLIVGFKYYPCTAQTWKWETNPKVLCQVDKTEPEITEASSVRYTEVEAYDWIRNNTTFDDVLISDIYLMPHMEGNFIASAFSERRLWLDGWTYNRQPGQEEEAMEKLAIVRKCFEGDSKAIETVKSEGVTYMIHVIAANPEYTMDDSIADEVYRNDSIVVYILK